MGKKILVIDDDPVGGILMESRLRKEGHDVFRALNGELGLKQVITVSPDIIILDIEMPEMNGYTFIMELQKMETVKKAPIIVLTAHSENQAIFARKGIKHYLVKPVNFDVLFARISELAP